MSGDEEEHLGWLHACSPALHRASVDNPVHCPKLGVRLRSRDARRTWVLATAPNAAQNRERGRESACACVCVCVCVYCNFT